MDYFSGWCKSKRRLDGSVAIVTGCNTGIGKETVLDFFSRGARVIMACRDVTKANDARKDIEDAMTKQENTGELVVEKLDLCSFASVREFVNRVSARESRIDILVNNAGVMMCPEGKTEDGFETHIGSNHLAHALLTILLLPKLKSSDAARVLFISSYLHLKGSVDLENMNFEKRPYNAYMAYCNSKAANVLFAKGLANELKKHNVTNVTTYAIHPGVIRTDISKHFSSTMAWGATWLFRNVLGLFIKSPKCGAQTTVYCAIDEQCANESGLYYADCAVSKPSKQCRDESLVEKFWLWTLESLNMKNKDVI